MSPPGHLLEESSDGEGEPPLQEDTPRQRDIIRHVAYDAVEGEDDAFTLHSQAESDRYPRESAPPPPSYYSRKPAKQMESTNAHANIERVASSSTLSRRDGKTRGRRISSTRADDDLVSTPNGIDGDVAVTPPSYHSKPRVRRSSTGISAQAVVPVPQEQRQTTRDDAETWKIIQMERDADLFRREFLLSCCLDVWIKGLRWVEVSIFSLTNVYLYFIH